MYVELREWQSQSECKCRFFTCVVICLMKVVLVNYVSVHYRKNCSGNPHCLNGLGEKKWLNSDDPVIPNVDPDSLKRSKVWYNSIIWCSLG